ncbi:MAG TPA: hypothetical protein VFO79_14550, partial [Xanthomonadales bacterium]|nr:hypothetical protein [Xanthomonadales bacterium]
MSRARSRPSNAPAPCEGIAALLRIRLVLLRKTSAHNNMELFSMKSALLTTALLLAGATTTASAQDEAKNYITGQVLRSDSECEGFRDGVAPLGLTATCDTSDVGFRVAYGRQFTDLFGLEVGYQDAGEGEAVAFVPGAP